MHEKVNLNKHFRKGTFSSSEDGYLWETVEVSGKLGALKDDLRAKLRTEAGLGVDSDELELQKFLSGQDYAAAFFLARRLVATGEEWASSYLEQARSGLEIGDD